jgi:hypothetical protein
MHGAPFHVSENGKVIPGAPETPRGLEFLSNLRGRPIEVICIYCETGTVSGEPLSQFTVADVLAMDEQLAKHLSSWPEFRPIDDSGPDGSRFANHCPHCGTEQDDRDLHSEPGDPFFGIPHSAPGAIRLTPLAGEIRLSGDEHFMIE